MTRRLPNHPIRTLDPSHVVIKTEDLRHWIALLEVAYESIEAVTDGGADLDAVDFEMAGRPVAKVLWHIRQALP